MHLRSSFRDIGRLRTVPRFKVEKQLAIIGLCTKQIIECYSSAKCNVFTSRTLAVHADQLKRWFRSDDVRES